MNYCNSYQQLCNDQKSSDSGFFRIIQRKIVNLHFTYVRIINIKN